MVKATKATVKKSRVSRKQEVTLPDPNILPGGKVNNFLNNFPERLNNLKKSKTFYLILIAIGLTLLVMLKKSWFIAAFVNGSPITNLELQSKLNQQYKTQTLNQLINEKIIISEAQKFGAVPSENEINSKITELETSVGGKEVLDSLLAQQNQTRDTLKDQVRMQLAITKLYEKEATASANEVAKYIEDNKETLRATDSAEQEKEAAEAIKNQKMSQIFSQKFQELREKAKIQIF